MQKPWITALRRLAVMEITSSPSAYTSVSMTICGSSREGSFGVELDWSTSRCLRSREAISLLEEEEDGFFLFLSSSVEMSTSHSSSECHNSSNGCSQTDRRAGDQREKQMKTLAGTKDVDLWGLRFTKLHSNLQQLFHLIWDCKSSFKEELSPTDS